MKGATTLFAAAPPVKSIVKLCIGIDIVDRRVVTFKPAALLLSTGHRDQLKPAAAGHAYGKLDSEVVEVAGLLLTSGINSYGTK